MSSAGILFVLKAAGLAVFAAALAVVLAAEVYAALIGTAGRTPVPDWLGNHASNLDRLREGAGGDAAFTFAVVGDTKSYGTFARLCEPLRREPPAFMLVLGDMVSRGTPAHHAFLHRQAAGTWGVTCPVLCVPGNHDTSADEFPLARWEEMYGPSLFAFEYRQNLFIGLRLIERQSTAESLAFLEATLKAKRARNRRAFVFLHCPPALTGRSENDGFTGDQAFMALCAAHKVDHVFAGDYHGYLRATTGTTVYQTIGTGGMHLRDRYLTAHMLLLVTVEPDRVCEQLVSTPPVVRVGEVAAEAALADVWPWLRAHWIAAVLMNVVLAAGLGMVSRTLFRLFWPSAA
ncbi:MAG: metallophosphoesterase [Planctomycetota bacterium]